MDSEKEEQIIRRVQNGDVNAFALLVDAYQGAVFNLVVRMTGRGTAAEDLAQEIFLKAYASMGRFDAQRRFFPWLYTIALNTVRNHLKRKTPPQVPLVEGVAGALQTDERLSPDGLLRQKQQKQMLAHLIRRLPEPCREALVLRYFQELSFEDAAQVLDISVSAAKMRVYRGLRMLAAWMNENRGAA
jgi:RNA polymerase sigma-70 factor (ECF subfamily)